MPDIFVTCPGGLEQLLFHELIALGISDVREGKSGVYIPRIIENVYKANYCSRIATRVLWPVTCFPCPDQNALYRNTKQIDWRKYLNLKKTFAIDPNVNHPNLRNSLFAAMVVKDAICDYFRDKTGSRPNIEVANPDVQLNLFINNGHATISLDTSGAPLYKRGYRKQTSTAPLQESLASAILTRCGYSSKEVFCDPFCGSGTFLIEAAMMASNTPAGFFRKTWGFFHLPDFLESKWQEFKLTSDHLRIPLQKNSIFGADIDPEALKICAANIETAGFADSISLERKDIRSFFPEFVPTSVICNPPYGKRLKAANDLYQALGKFIQFKCPPEIKAFCLIPDPLLAKETGLSPTRLMPLKNGGLEIELYQLKKATFF